MQSSLLRDAFFSKTRRADLPDTNDDVQGAYTASVVVNETALCLMGFTSADDSFNKVVYTPSGKGQGALRIVGVIRDFHITSIYENVKPMVYYATENFLNYLTVRLRPDEIATTLRDIDGVWKELIPERPIKRFL